MSELTDDIQRGCLKNGEPIEAKWGMGWRSGEQEPEPDWDGGICPICGDGAAYFGGEFVECAKGHTKGDVDKLGKQTTEGR